MRTMICVEGGEEIVPDLTRRRRLAAGKGSPRAHRGRGLCSACYSAAVRAGTLLDYERKTLDTESMLEDAYMLVMEHEIRDTAVLAKRIGLSREALTRGLQRAAEAGDERSIEVRSHLPWMRAA